MHVDTMSKQHLIFMPENGKTHFKFTTELQIRGQPHDETSCETCKARVKQCTVNVHANHVQNQILIKQRECSKLWNETLDQIMKVESAGPLDIEPEILPVFNSNVKFEESEPLESEGKVIDSHDKKPCPKTTHPSGGTTVTVLPLFKPKGPLEVINLTKPEPGHYKASCTLTWKGGVETINGHAGDFGPIKKYLVETCYANYLVWRILKKTPHTFFQVEDLIPGREYKFRVKAISEHGESEPLETEGTLKIIDDRKPLPVPDPPNAPVLVKWTDTHWHLSWGPHKKVPGTPPVYSILEKTVSLLEDFVQTGRKPDAVWEKAAQTPLSEAIMTGLTEGRLYQFRVIYINKTGRSEPSPPSLFLAKHRSINPFGISEPHSEDPAISDCNSPFNIPLPSLTFSPAFGNNGSPSSSLQLVFPLKFNNQCPPIMPTTWLPPPRPQFGPPFAQSHMCPPQPSENDSRWLASAIKQFGAPFDLSPTNPLQPPEMGDIWCNQGRQGFSGLLDLGRQQWQHVGQTRNEMTIYEMNLGRQQWQHVGQNRNEMI
uniref:Twitchin n=1 Tax=Cacopsylla melanoneura TaxID=428564 RepID=A0A8D8RI73_9HEMI